MKKPKVIWRKVYLLKDTTRWPEYFGEMPEAWIPVRKSVTDGGRGSEAYEFYSPYAAAWVRLDALGPMAAQIVEAIS